MAFIDDFGRKVSETSQSVIQKGRGMADTAKLNSKISGEEANINDNYCRIGKLYASMHASDCEKEFKEMLESIHASEKNIEEYKEQIRLIKGVVRCESCGAEVSIDSAFCSSCGAPVPKREQNQSDGGMVMCKRCGKYVKKGMRFCTQCGNPMPRETFGESSNKPKVKVCPKCGFTSTDPDTLFCSSCGVMLKAENADANVVSEPNVQSAAPKIKSCPNCGFKTDDSEINFCVECGAKLL